MSGGRVRPADCGRTAFACNSHRMLLKRPAPVRQHRERALIGPLSYQGERPDGREYTRARNSIQTTYRHSDSVGVAVGYKIRRQLRDALGPKVKGLQRLVALEIADNVNDDTRTGWATLADLARWTGAGNPDTVRDMLTRLANAGWEFRVPIGKGKDGRLVYAARGHSLTFRVPEFDAPAPSEHDLQEEGPTAVGPSSTKGLPPSPKGPTGVAIGPTAVAVGPTTVGPLSSAPQGTSPLSPATRAVRESGVVTPDEERELIDWINSTHKPRGPGWWHHVTANGDLATLAANWRAEQTTKPPPKPAWCGRCDERTRLAEDDAGRPKRCACHPLHGQPLARAR